MNCEICRKRHRNFQYGKGSGTQICIMAAYTLREKELFRIRRGSYVYYSSWYTAGQRIYLCRFDHASLLFLFFTSFVLVLWNISPKRIT